ncbi:RNaseH domain-containing protein [Laspinema olomoucense]|uniref:RNaseH domain-containing protein n=1 Tax=Laspinema olomoucense TaxID=3231600 RepID=UPI0021BB0427|nr:RNaseH domain-containing protein [Laspinema sp. D3c]MCT7992569.1 RNaseH domain-containing protein [Laspinema sp. D3c]
MNDEIFDNIQVEDEEMTQTTLQSDTLYISLGKPTSLKIIPLAFTVPDCLKPVIVEGFNLAWTKKALGILAEIQKATGCSGNTTAKNLPYASLRGFLEVGLNDLGRIQSNVGLSLFDLNGKLGQDPIPFAYLNGGNFEAIRKALRPILNEWLTGYFNPFAEQEGVAPEVVDRLNNLYEEENLLSLAPLESQVIPWNWSKQTGTTHHEDRYDYRALVDYVARAIAGNEIFQGLGPMKRVVSAHGSFTTGMAELITKPIALSQKAGEFSLVVKLEIVTYPSLHQPLLKIDVTKRRWFTNLKPPRFNFGNISGFVFSENYSDRAFSYKVLCQSEKQGKEKIWHWKIDKDFEVLRRKLHLPLKTTEGQDINPEQIALGKASTDSCKVMLTYRNGLQEGKHGIKVGVPEIDKLEAFEAIGNLLNPLGFEPFQSYSEIKWKAKKGHPTKLDNTASRMINLPTLLSAVLEYLEKGDGCDFTSNYIERLDDNELIPLLQKHFSVNLSDIMGERKSLKFNNNNKKQFQELTKMIEANQKIIRKLYPNQRPLLIIFYENELQREMKLVEAIVRVLWNGAIEVMPNRLPANTHGPRTLLPGANSNAQERSRHRIEAWKPIVKQLTLRKQRTFCLVLARKFYPDSSKEEKYHRDDLVNKPSTRQALAELAGSCVQFILPIETNKQKENLKLDNFFHRGQSALKDLLYAHSGWVDDVKQKVDHWLEATPVAQRPKEIIGITIVRKQKGRTRGSIESTFLPIAVRLKVETGECELCCAYEKGSNLEKTPWRKFPDAISFISKISPVKLGTNKEARQNRFMEFAKEIISTSVDEGNQPVVMIDSSNCVHLWPWLGDRQLDAHHINFKTHSGSPIYEHMEQEWQGVRLIRFRQDLAPGIIDKKVRSFMETSLEDTRTKKQLQTLKANYQIPSASSKTGLFRLITPNETGHSAYLSVGKTTIHTNKRGPSCYRETEINVAVKSDDDSKEKIKNNAGLEVHQIGTRPPFIGQFPTPNPLEIVITLKQPDDDCDRLAGLVESLRYSFGHYDDWSSLPAPLFFERVVRDYISEFALDNLDNQPEDDDDDGDHE